MLKRVFDLRKKIAAFMQSKDKVVLQFTYEELMNITSHLNDLNKNLQGKDNLVHELFNVFQSV